jgi:hypothetical protein
MKRRRRDRGNQVTHRHCGIARATRVDYSNEDHRPAVCFRVDGMRGQPAQNRNEPNRRRPKRAAHDRRVRRYMIHGPADQTRG